MGFRARAYSATAGRKLGNSIAYLSLGVVATGWIYLSIPKTPKLEPSRKATLPEVKEMLSMDKIKEIFSRNEQIVGCNDWTLHINSVGSNIPCEDRHSENILGDGILVGVFDGHGGGECADLVQKYLASYVKSKLLQIESDSGSMDQNVSKKQLISSALRKAFMDLDNDIINGVIQDKVPTSWSLFGPSSATLNSIRNNLKSAIAGAIVCYATKTELYVACTGDSRAVIGRKSGYQRDGQEKYQAIPLSIDQTARNPSEYARILEEHPGEESTVIARGRVLGGLMPTRAFGDARYKWPISTLETILPFFSPKRRVPSSYKSPPYVTAIPEVVTYELDKNDSFLIMATDGLWDELSNEEAVQATADLIKNQEGNGDKNLATGLIKSAISGGEIDMNRVQHSLSIPSPLSRRYRDDITVSLVQFGKSGSGLEPVTLSIVKQDPQLPIWERYLLKWSNKSKL